MARQVTDDERAVVQQALRQAGIPEEVLKEFEAYDLDCLFRGGYKSAIKLKFAKRQDLLECGLQHASVGLLLDVLAQGQGTSTSGAGQAVSSRKGPSPQYVLKVSSEVPDLFLYANAATGKATDDFYLDPGRKTIKQLLLWLTNVYTCYRKSPGISSSLKPQRTAVVSGLTKTGKSTTARRFLPAVIQTYGIKDHNDALRKGELPAPLADTPEETGVKYCIWDLNCAKFQRRNGEEGVKASLLALLKRNATKLGFTEAANMPSISTAEDIALLLDCLPSDQVHVMVMDEAQSLFLLEQADTRLDFGAVREIRRFFKALISESPAHVAWVYTGSMMSTIWANIAESPVNGFAPLLHCDNIHLSTTVSEEEMAVAWSKLKATYPNAPDELLLMAPKHHAMLAYLCEEAESMPRDLPGPKRVEAVGNLVQRTVRDKLLPEMLADMRVVLATMDSSTLYGKCQEGEDLAVTQLAVLQRLLDPARGVRQNKLHRYFGVMMGPYLKTVSGEDALVSGSEGKLVYVDSPLQKEMLQMVTTSEGRLVQNIVDDSRLGPNTYWELERYRRFGELCSTASKEEYLGYKFVQNELVDMAEVLQQTDTIYEQPWFKEVLKHPRIEEKRRNKFQNTRGNLEAFKVLEWGLVSIRHCLSHELASTAPLLDACANSLGPFFLRMDEVLLENQRRILKRVSPKVPPAAQLQPLRIARGVRSACLVARSVRLRSASNGMCTGRLL